MPDHAGDLGVHQLLGDDGALLGVGLIVLGQQLELDLVGAELEAGGVGFVDGHAHTVLVVLPKVCDGSGKRTGVTDLDHTLFLLPATRQPDRHRQRQCNRYALHVHA